MSKQQQLDALNKEWAAKDLPLKAGATQAVPGEGNPDADILFVGEGPGKDEDEQGRPFVGAAGKFLTELIGSIGLKREEIFIANMVKHRPPGNRDPLPEELAAYAPWLDEQVRIITPKLIVTLGRFSMAHFLGQTLSISNIHGQPKRNAKGQVIIPMYHPAAALYRGNLRPVLVADFQKILKVLALITQGSPVNEEEDQKEAVSQQKQAALF
jgi:DNA polymerase